MMYHIHEAHLRIFFWHLLMNFEKLKEPEFPKDDQKKKNNNNTRKDKKNWRYHHFTHVYQKPQSGTVPEIRSDTIQFCHSRPFFAIYPPPLRTSPS